MESVNQYRRFYLITSPRTASNLLVRILALDEQPNILSRKSGGYFFLPVVQLYNELKSRGKPVGTWTQDERDRMIHSYQDCFKELEEFVQTADAEGKIAFIKEHAEFMTEPTAQSRFVFGQDSVKEPPWTVQIPSTYGPGVTRSLLNETVLPDEFLQTLLPTFLIRHPALVLPSRYRAFIDIEGAEAVVTEETELKIIMTFHWIRTLYDWYTQLYLSRSEFRLKDDDDDMDWPLVLDADDVIADPAVIVRFSEVVGLDPSKLKFKWAPASEEELARAPNNIFRRMRSTLLASSGVIGTNTALNLDIDVEARKWMEEFGEAQGEKLEKWVRAAMPDYEYMKAKRLRPRPHEVV